MLLLAIGIKSGLWIVKTEINASNISSREPKIKKIKETLFIIKNFWCYSDNIGFKNTFINKTQSSKKLFMKLNKYLIMQDIAISHYWIHKL